MLDRAVHIAPLDLDESRERDGAPLGAVDEYPVEPGWIDLVAPGDEGPDINRVFLVVWMRAADDIAAIDQTQGLGDLLRGDAGKGGLLDRKSVV